MPAPRQIHSHAALRGIAAMLVVAYHLQFGGGYRFALERYTPAFTRSYLFVDLFFILSGFIISYVNDAGRAKGVSLGEMRSFMRARVARLYPLHFFCLAYLVLFRVLITALQYVRHKPVDFWQADSLQSLASQVVLLNAWYPRDAQWNIPSWSISAEFFAYALFPIVVTLHARARASCELAMAALSVAFFSYILATSGSLDIIVGLAPARCIAGFFLGMLLYFHRDAVARLPEIVLTGLQIASVAAILLILTTPVADPWIVPAFFGLVATTWTDQGLLPKLLRRRPLLWLGDISYSVYLNHVCVIEILEFLWGRSAQHVLGDGALNRSAWIALVYATTLCVSHLTFKFVERPMRQWLAMRWLGRKAYPIRQSPAAP